jgi:hypothetical protein
MENGWEFKFSSPTFNVDRPCHTEFSNVNSWLSSFTHALETAGKKKEVTASSVLCCIVILSNWKLSLYLLFSE